MSVASLHLDPKNPRLGREVAARAPREIIQHLFEHDKAIEVAESIAKRGYFPNEPLLAIQEEGRHVVIEGNRRLAALKALREPGLLDGKLHRQVERLSRRFDVSSIAKVPTTIAPDRRSTDRLVAGRHIGTAVVAWKGENRASFILDKLEEGYDNDELRDELGFTLQDIQQARQTRAIADMARSLELPEEVKAKIDNPRASVFTTLERVFDSSVGRKHLRVEPDSEHGLRGTTTKAQFLKGFKRLVTDLALGHESSRTLNTNENMEEYFRKRWRPEDRPAAKRGGFVPADVISGKSVASPAGSARPTKPAKRSKEPSRTVLPRDFKLRHGSERLLDIHRELTKLKRDDFPNAGAVLLRAFFELSVIEYLERIGELDDIKSRIEKKSGRLPFGVPTLRQLAPELKRIAKNRLSHGDANRVEKAVKHDAAAPFTLSDLHAFVHQSRELPGPRDIQQFWLRTEPLFRLMLESDEEEAGA